jgi:hypothetical protein
LITAFDTLPTPDPIPDEVPIPLDPIPDEVPIPPVPMPDEEPIPREEEPPPGPELVPCDCVSWTLPRTATLAKIPRINHGFHIKHFLSERETALEFNG